MKKILSAIVFAIILLLNSTLQAKELTLEEVQDAVCRVSVITGGGGMFGFGGGQYSKVMGTGTVYKESDSKYYIMTNGHVVGNSKSATVEFFKAGYKSTPIPAKVEFVSLQPNTNIDMSILSVDKAVFANTANKPRVIQIAPKAFTIQSKTKIYGAGFPAGRWCQIWCARIKEANENTVTFNMPPEGGQSGSGILTTIKDKNGEDNTVITGIVSWRFDENNNSYGGGVSLNTIYNIFQNDKPKGGRISAAWHCTSEEFTTEAPKVCSNCGKSPSEHFVVWNRITKRALINEDGQVMYFCSKPTSKNIVTQNDDIVTVQKYIELVRGCNKPKTPKPPEAPEPPSNDGPPKGGDLYPDDIEPKDKEPAPAPPAEEPTPKPPTPPPAPKVDENAIKLAELQKRIDSLNAQIKNLEGSNSGLDAQVKVFRDKAAQLEAEKAKLQSDNKVLADNTSKLEATVTGLKSQTEQVAAKNAELVKAVDSVKSEKSALEGKAVKLEAEKTATQVSLNDTINKKNEVEKKLVSVTGDLNNVLSNNKDLIAKLGQLAEANKDTLDKLNIPYISKTFGGFGEFLTGLLGALASGTLITTIWHKFIYPQLVRRLGLFPTKILQFVGKRKLSKYLDSQKKTSDETVSSGYNNNEGALIPESRPAPELQPESTIELPEIKVQDISSKDIPVTTSTVSITENVAKTVPKDQASEFFIQNNNSLGGMSVKEWAIKSGLYRSAVKALSEGRLIDKAGAEPLNGKRVAQAIEDYVTDRFIMQLQLVNMEPVGNLYHEAYLGYLYWQAVEKLKRGEFSVLGYKEAAEAIERFVKTEFLKKVKL